MGQEQSSLQPADGEENEQPQLDNKPSGDKSAIDSAISKGVPLQEEQVSSTPATSAGFNSSAPLMSGTTAAYPDQSTKLSLGDSTEATGISEHSRITLAPTEQPTHQSPSILCEHTEASVLT